MAQELQPLQRSEGTRSLPVERRSRQTRRRGQVRAARAQPRQDGPYDGHSRRKRDAMRRLPLRAG